MVMSLVSKYYLTLLVFNINLRDRTGDIKLQIQLYIRNYSMFDRTYNIDGCSRW